MYIVNPETMMVRDLRNSLYRLKWQKKKQQNFRMPEGVWDKLDDLSINTRQSKTDIMLHAICLYLAACDYSPDTDNYPNATKEIDYDNDDDT